MDIEDPLKYVNLYVNGIGSYQKKGYDFIINHMKNRSFNTYNAIGDIREMPTFENMEAFGYTLLENPIEALDIIYPNNVLDEMSEKDFETSDLLKQEEVISQIIGKRGLSHIMDSVDEIKNSQHLRYNFDYKPKILNAYGPIFNENEIHKYSAKMSNICSIIKKSKGIVIIYSKYIDGGIVPLALMLEELGFSRYSSQPNTKNLFKKPRREPIDSITMKSKSEFNGSDGNVFHPAKYVMITGEKAFSPNNAADIKYATNANNTYGENVKVILISKAGAEGLDFKNIRQVHILEPWYNMNLIEQIIGRGVRHLSHCQLPFEERNVEIYLHSTNLENGEESADLYVYRLAEKKALQIGKITRLLKENAVDCILNIGQNNLTIEKISARVSNQNIQINLASGKTITYQVGDRPFTDICDYMDNCNYTCSPNVQIEEKDIITHTYNNDFVKMNQNRIISRIKELFREHYSYKRDNLIKSINIVKQYPIEQIYAAFTFLIENKNEILVDRYGRIGNLINHDEYYIFQPIEITDDYSSMYERSVPIDYKRKSIRLGISKEIVREPQTDVIEKNEETTTQNYEELVKTIAENYRLVFETKKLPKGEKNWYKHAAMIIDSELINRHNIDIEAIRLHAMNHIMDVLTFEEKMKLADHFFKENREPTTPIETMIKTYLNGLIVQYNEQIGVYITKEETNKLFIMSLETHEWIEADQEDLEMFSKELLKFDIPKSTIHALVGFINIFESKKSKTKEMVFKIKDLTQTRNNVGAKCDDAGKIKIIKLLNDIIESNVYTEENTDHITQQGLCAILELLMREYTKVRKNNKNYFLHPEQAIKTNIAKFSFA
jgi:hypothetical protein